MALLLLGATWLGMAYHRWAFDATQSGRFIGDIRRNYGFGSAALESGYLNLYEDQLRDNPPLESKLDYPPLRLATFMAWAAWNRWTLSDGFAWREDYASNAWLMWHNQMLEWLGAVAAFLIVRHWLRECATAALPLGEQPPAWTGIGRATLAFLFLWFDPGMAIIAHGWPSPNMWVVPYYLWAVYFCLRDRWFYGGLVMGVGAMLQGQQLFVAGIFVLWPLFSGRPSRAMRWTCGFAVAFSLVAAGWLLSLRDGMYASGRHINWPAVLWVGASVSLLGLVSLRTTLRRLEWRWFVIPAAGAIWILSYPARSFVTVMAACSLVLCFWFSSWTLKRYLLPLALSLCLLGCMPFFGASAAWWKIGFLYGAERFSVMAWPAMNNLPAILQRYFHWYQINQIVFTLPQGMMGDWPGEAIPVTIRQLLFSIFVVLLVVAAVGMALQWRRRDPRLLVALALPWVLFYTIPAQMSPRYTVFISGVGAICIGGSVGMWLLVLLFSVLTVEQTALTMMSSGFMAYSAADDPLFNRGARDLLNQFSPALSWAVMVAAISFVWVSLVRSREIQPLLPDESGRAAAAIPSRMRAEAAGKLEPVKA